MIPERLHAIFLRQTLALDIDLSEIPEGAATAREMAMPPLQVALTMPYPASGVRDTRAPGVRMEWVEDDGPPLDFGGGRTHGHIREIFLNPDDAERLLWRELYAMGKKLAPAWAKEGLKQSRSATGHVTFSNADLKERFRDIPLDLSDPTRVCRRSIADRPFGQVGVAWMRAKLDAGLENGLDDYPDPNTLHMLETGVKLAGKPAHVISLVPPLGSALPFLRPIAEQLAGELKGGDAKYTWSLFPQAWPSRYHSVGGVCKGGKLRPITDAGSPHDVMVDGQYVAINAAAKAFDPDAVEEEDVKWVQTRTFLVQAEVVHSIYTTLETVTEFQVDAEALRHLRPMSFCSDCRAFFRQFPMSARDAFMSGLVLPRFAPEEAATRPAEEQRRQGLYLVDTPYEVFGPTGAPAFATDVAHAQTTLQRLDTWEWEDHIRAEAEGGCEWCRLLWPEPLERLMDLRRQTLAHAAGEPEDSTKPHKLRRRQDDLLSSEQYIDDRKGDALGTVRALHAMWVCWYHAQEECANLPVSMEKAQLGYRVEHLGVDWHSVGGTVTTKPARKEKLNTRLDRMRSVALVEHAELESLLGSLGFVGQVVDGIRTLLGRSFKVVHNPAVWRLDKRSRTEAMDARQWLRTDLSDAQRLMNEHTASAYVTIPWSLDLSQSWLTPSDSCRCLSGREYTGLGAFVTFPRYIKYWHLQLPFDMVSAEDGIEVHVTERLCPNITIAVMPELAHGSLIQLIDNLSAVACLDRKSAKDLRLQELNLLTADQLEERQLRTETRWISTEENEWADLLSRGKVHGPGGFVEKALAAGAERLVEIPLSVMPGVAPVGPPDLLPLLRRLQLMSQRMREQARARNTSD